MRCQHLDSRSRTAPAENVKTDRHSIQQTLLLQLHTMSTMVYLTPKIERIIVLLSASPEGEARLPMPKGMAYKE
jgi:hypothetical protein